MLSSLVKDYLWQSQDYNGYTKSKITYQKNIIHGYTVVDNEALELKHIGMITHQSFLDLGFKGPLIVEFAHNLESIAKLRHFLHKGKIGALVTYNYPDIKTFSAEQIYAIAGHEAVHFTHKHFFIENATWWGIFLGGLSFSLAFLFKQLQPISINCFFEIRTSIILTSTAILFENFTSVAVRWMGKLSEADADITSARHLGTAKPLSEFFQRRINDQQQIEGSITDIMYVDLEPVQSQQ